jgi:hypothetical protein
MGDFLMLLLLVAAFAGGFGYVRACGGMIRPAGPAAEDGP